MLDVDHDVGVVEQHPAPLTLALAPHRPLPQAAQPVLDLVDDRLDLPVVARRTQQEDVGDEELIADVEGQDVLGQLVRRRLVRMRSR
jgi:hypothetical protein